nr:hypothetical protein OG296_05115 [Streptomyces sp. NBC_01001]
MTIRVSAGPPAQPHDRRAARATRELLAGELARVRAGALAWRNGLGALLAGLVGFGLVKGRSDVTQLDSFFAAVVGVLLLAALVAGAIAAVLIMRAAHGRPYAVAVSDVLGSSLAEADSSQRSLRRGVQLTFLCITLLTTAVALTWYGPAKDKPRIEVRLTNGSVHCGEVVSLAAGRLNLKTSKGRVEVDLKQAIGMAPVESCPTTRG